MTIRNGKKNFTTTMQPELIERLRMYCWNNKKKMNEVIETLIINHLQQEKQVTKCRL